MNEPIDKESLVRDEETISLLDMDSNCVMDGEDLVVFRVSLSSFVAL